MTRICSLAALMALLGGPAAAQTTPFVDNRTTGWWVIAANLSEHSGIRAIDEAGFRIRAEAARCGFELFNDRSAKFQGFTAGFHVYLRGAYPSFSDAEAAAARLKPCVPTVYTKFGRYLGE